MRRLWRGPGVVCLTFTLFASAFVIAGIADTRHNLSTAGSGPVTSTTEGEICVFCHTPHNSRPGAPFLWNREDSTASYTTYDSSTLLATVGQPTGGSKLCLSCHDGTVALGALVSRPAEIPFAGGIRFMPAGPANLETDISDDHPVSFIFDETLAIDQGELVSPSTLTAEVRLDADSMLQCTSCHDPHDDTFGKFLVKPNDFGAICVTCHLPTDWNLGAHSVSVATWNGTLPDPWPHTPYLSVDENSCENCHRPHTAGGHDRLLNYEPEEDNCLTCHNGNVAATDIESEILKVTSSHAPQDFFGIHDPIEDFSLSVTTHVECVDCHNPHRANDSTASAPNVPGPLLGVSGITSGGSAIDEVTAGYEVCFKCHANNNVITTAPVAREYPELNTLLEFDITNPSFHPIEAAGKNPNVPSLLSPYTESSIITCWDCHNNNDGPEAGGIGPNGPHGSDNDFLLERNYSMVDLGSESPEAYALCYKCHDRASILNDDSFTAHDRHIRRTPCSVCHDPHGISSAQGNATNNNHLINFDLSVVSPSIAGELRFEDTGLFSGQCFLRCHNNNHSPRDYP